MRFLLTFLCVLIPTLSCAQNASVPGVPHSPYPTMNHLTIEWPIAGDDNLNSTVGVRYRITGTTPWLPALPLRRIPAGSNQGYNWSNRHSGSLFNLAADTSYEVELAYQDPDGGNRQEIISASTRAYPTYPSNPNLRQATPGTLNSILNTAQPGDVITLLPGNYSGFTIDRSGSPGNPIVVRAEEGAVIQGEVGIFLRHDIYLDQLNVSGRIRFNGSNNVTITRCQVTASPSQFNGDGIVTLIRAENAYIADNIVIGTTAWVENAMGASGANRGEGILVSGPGHVVEHNRVSGFRDGISFLEDGSEDQFSIDVIENELSENLDDAIEADFCQHNCRIIRNRATNSFIAFSSQPSLGGPTWFVGNVAYNVAHVAFKLYRGSIGDVLLHNTVVKAGDALSMYTSSAIDRMYSRNNLFIGGPGGDINGFNNGSGRVIQATALSTANADLDYDGFGSTTGSFTGRFGPSITFNNLAQMRSLTSETHGIELGLESFEQVITLPVDPLVQHTIQDLRLDNTSPAVDAGEVLANVLLSYNGTAPDLGAYEAGQDLPAYGPRLGPLFADGFESLSF